MEIAPLITYSHSIVDHIAVASDSLLLTMVTLPHFLETSEKSGELTGK